MLYVSIVCTLNEYICHMYHLVCILWIDMTYIHLVCTLWIDIDRYISYISLSSPILCTQWIDIDTYIIHVLLSIHISCTLWIKRSPFTLCTIWIGITWIGTYTDSVHTKNQEKSMYTVHTTNRHWYTHIKSVSSDLPMRIHSVHNMHHMYQCIFIVCQLSMYIHSVPILNVYS